MESRHVITADEITSKSYKAKDLHIAQKPSVKKQKLAVKCAPF